MKAFPVAAGSLSLAHHMGTLKHAIDCADTLPNAEGLPRRPVKFTPTELCFACLRAAHKHDYDSLVAFRALDDALRGESSRDNAAQLTSDVVRERSNGYLGGLTPDRAAKLLEEP